MDMAFEIKLCSLSKWDTDGNNTTAVVGETRGVWRGVRHPAKMSHVEAFGQLRSFVVGLEIKARDLRKVLETSRENGKWVNGKDGTGVGERCARGETVDQEREAYSCSTSLVLLPPLMCQLRASPR